MPKRIAIGELSAAIKSAVEQVLEKKGALGVEKIWVGFVAPEAIATLENAEKVAAVIAKESHASVTPSVAQIAESGGGAPAARGAPRPVRIIGLIHDPNVSAR
jgi:hypothetical protein